VIVLFLVELYVRWQVKRRTKAWNKMKNTHFYVANDEIIKVKR
jgi:hypothetical protein